MKTLTTLFLLAAAGTFAAENPTLSAVKLTESESTELTQASNKIELAKKVLAKAKAELAVAQAELAVESAAADFGATFQKLAKAANCEKCTIQNGEWVKPQEKK